MPVISKPSLYSFSGNCADIVVVSLAKVNFKLTVGAVVLTEAYTPYMGQVTIPLRSLLESLIKGLDAVEGSKPITKVTYIVDMVEESFYCLSGGVRDVGNIEAWLKNNFLTWRPQVARTTFHAPQYLSYAALVGCTVKAKGYFANGDQVVDLKTLSAGTLYNIDVTWGNLVGKFRESPKYVDLWVEGTGVKTYTQRFCLIQNADCQDVFVWANSVGGVDTAIFTGDLVHTQNSSSSTAIVDRAEVEFDVDYSSVYKKYTGYITEGNDQLWTLDFFNSALKYHLSDSSLRRIVVSKPKTERTKGEIVGYEFDFSYSDQSKYLNLPRLGDDQLLVFLEEGEELFFLTPRLNSFAGVSVGGGDILFPVQYAHLEQWFKMPLADILSMFTIGPHSHQIGDVVGLDDRLTELENRPGGGGGGIPDAHASSHAEGGSDPITPDSIGASAKAHTHDKDYSDINHTHDDIYASVDHTHDDRYAKKNGDQLEDFATKNLDVKGIATFGDAIVMTNATGGGGADLPEGNLNEILYYNGSEWVGKHKDTFGFLTDGALVGYATQAWVIERIPSVPAWALQPNKPTYDWTEIVNKPTSFTPSAHNQAIDTITGLQGVLDNKLAKSIWDAEFTVTATGLVHKRTAIFNDAILMSNATGGGGGTSDYNELENLPFIGGIKVSGSKTLVDYGLMNHGLATQDWVNTRIPNVYAWALQAVKPAYGWAEITGKPTSMPASDVYAWAKASVKPTYTASEVGALPTFNGEFISDMTKISTDGVRWYLPSTLNKPSNYGLTLDFNGQQWYYRLAFDTESGNIHYYNRINAGDYILRGTLYHTGNLAPASVNNTGNTLVQRAANGFIYSTIYHDTFPIDNSPIRAVGYKISQADGFHRFCTPDHFKAQLGLYHTGNQQPSLPISGHNINALSYHQTNGSFEGSPSVWASYIILGHGDSSSYYANILRFPFHEANGVPQYQRKEAGVNSGWKTFWTVENCGSSAFDWSMRNATIAGTAIANGFRVKDDNGMWQGSKYTGGLRDIDVVIASVTGNVILYPHAGNVGIGTNNPTAKLHVNGNQIVEGTATFKGAIIMTNY